MISHVIYSRKYSIITVRMSSNCERLLLLWSPHRRPRFDIAIWFKVLICRFFSISLDDVMSPRFVLLFYAFFKSQAASLRMYVFVCAIFCAFCFHSNKICIPKRSINKRINKFHRFFSLISNSHLLSSATRIDTVTLYIVHLYKLCHPFARTSIIVFPNVKNIHYKSLAKTVPQFYTFAEIKNLIEFAHVRFTDEFMRVRKCDGINELNMLLYGVLVLVHSTDFYQGNEKKCAIKSSCDV